MEPLLEIGDPSQDWPVLPQPWREPAGHLAGVGPPPKADRLGRERAPLEAPALRRRERAALESQAEHRGWAERVFVALRGGAEVALRLHVQCDRPHYRGSEPAPERPGAVDLMPRVPAIALGRLASAFHEMAIVVQQGGRDQMFACAFLLGEPGALQGVVELGDILTVRGEIGRASCRERVCQYV